MLLSIIIPSYRRPHLLKWGLYSLSKQDISCEYEIIVLNDGIEDETESVCKDFEDKLNIRYIFTGQRNKEKIEPRPPGFAFNIGIKLSEGKFIILSSPEIFHTDNQCINKIIEILQKEPQAMAITEGKDDRINWERKGGFLKYIEKNSGAFDGFSNFRALKLLNTKLPFLMGIRKKEFIQIGGFDEDLIGYCFDDKDLVDRLILNNCHYVKINSTIIHLFHSRKKDNIKDIKKKWKYNEKIMNSKKGIKIRNQDREWGKFTIEEKKESLINNIQKNILNIFESKEEKQQNNDKIIDTNEMVSIIITTFNRAKRLQNSLYTIVKQSKPKNVEIVIVDDGSTDNTKEIINEYQEKYPEWNIRYIYHHKQELFSNPSIALNIALIYAKGDIIIQSGADLLHIGNVIEKLLKEFYKEEAYYGCRLLRLKLKYFDNLPINNLSKLQKYAESKGWVQPIVPQVEDDTKNNALPFCAIYRKEWIYKIGLFDEEYMPGGAEDRDFIYRMENIVPTKFLMDTWVCHQDHAKFAGEPFFRYGYDKNYKRSFNVAEGRENRWRKKILFIGNFNLFPFPGYLWDSLKQSFMRLGHYCKFYDPLSESITNSDLQKRTGQSSRIWKEKETTKKVQKIIDEFEPDIIIAGTGAQWDLISKLKTEALKIAWFGDLRNPNTYKNYKGIFDCLFVTNEGQIDEWKKIWQCPVFPIAFATLSTAHYKRNINKIYEVGFVGKHHKNQPNQPGYTNRMSLLQTIDNQFNLEVLANDWINTWKFYSKCKIIISDSHDDASITYGYTSNRFFNVVGCGAFCLVRYFPGLEFWGENGKHFVWFESNEEAIEKIRYYLKNEKKRQKIADAGYKWFHIYHNWIVRAKYMNGILKTLLERKEK